MSEFKNWTPGQSVRGTEMSEPDGGLAVDGPELCSSFKELNLNLPNNEFREEFIATRWYRTGEEFVSSSGVAQKMLEPWEIKTVKLFAITQKGAMNPANSTRAREVERIFLKLGEKPEPGAVAEGVHFLRQLEQEGLGEYPWNDQVVAWNEEGEKATLARALIDDEENPLEEHTLGGQLVLGDTVFLRSSTWIRKKNLVQRFTFQFPGGIWEEGHPSDEDEKGWVETKQEDEVSEFQTLGGSDIGWTTNQGWNLNRYLKMVAARRSIRLPAAKRTIMGIKDKVKRGNVPSGVWRALRGQLAGALSEDLEKVFGVENVKEIKDVVARRVVFEKVRWAWNYVTNAQKEATHKD